jgi:hypothetical protein
VSSFVIVLGAAILCAVILVFSSPSTLSGRKKFLLGAFLLPLIFIGLGIFTTAIGFSRHLRQPRFVSALHNGTNMFSFSLPTKGKYALQIGGQTNPVPFSIQGTVRVPPEHVPFDLHYKPSPGYYGVGLGFKTQQRHSDVHVDVVLTASDDALPITLRCIPVK